MKISLFALLIALSASTLPLSSCCSIVNGRSQDVKFSASPAGAKLIVDGQDRGTVPQVVSLKRSQTHTIRIEAPGYAPYEAVLDGSVSGWVFGNIALGGLIGLAVDFGTGAIYVFDDVNATLAPQVRVGSVQGKPEGARLIAQMKKI